MFHHIYGHFQGKLCCWQFWQEVQDPNIFQQIALESLESQSHSDVFENDGDGNGDNDDDDGTDSDDDDDDSDDDDDD